MSRSSSSCCLDGLVAKGGVAACVFGDADGPAMCLRPGIAVVDCLLGRLLASARYARVLCVCLDRPEEAVRRAAGLYLEQQASCPPDAAAADAKLTTCKTLDDASTALMHSNGDGEGATAVVLFSLSELLLERGVAATLAAVNSLRGPGDGDGGDNGGGERRTRPTLIAVVHTTLHPPHVLAQLLPRRSGGHGRDVFSAACFVRGNDGTLASELACEVQVVRVSVATGKVVEDTDYFAARARSVGGAGSGMLAQGPPVALLHPIPQLKKQQHVPAASVTAPTTTTTTTSTAAAVSATSNRSSNINHAAASVAGNRRLITFDSTDPEFDDDSDPDADLDL